MCVGAVIHFKGIPCKERLAESLFLGYGFFVLCINSQGKVIILVLCSSLNAYILHIPVRYNPFIRTCIVNIVIKIRSVVKVRACVECVVTIMTFKPKLNRRVRQCSDSKVLWVGSCQILPDKVLHRIALMVYYQRLPYRGYGYVVVDKHKVFASHVFQRIYGYTVFAEIYLVIFFTLNPYDMKIPPLVVVLMYVKNRACCSAYLDYWILNHPMFSIVINHADGLFKRIVRA